jgi:hypothetical protein
MPGPWKPWTAADMGEYTQLGYEFLYAMFGEGFGVPPGGYRDRYLHYDGPALRRQLAADLKILIPNDVKVFVFDCESTQSNDPEGIDWQNDTWYGMTLPPTPRGRTPPNPPSYDYTDGQAWEGAWYHAMADSLGM